MTFRRDVDLNPGQVQDRRGRRMGGGVAMGGGLGTLVIIALVILSGGNIGDVIGGLGAGQTDTGPLPSDLATECETGADANERQDCRLVGTVNSLDEYWSGAFQASGDQYQTPSTVLFSGGVETACGNASSAVGPFYCPLDQSIYIDLGFYEQIEQLGAEGGAFAEEYVVAHEYGHHVQNLLGQLEAGRDAGAEGGAVRTELMADCYAGVWGGNAVDTGFLEPLTQEQVNQALDLAATIGDDRIQEQTQGQVNPETWTHGSAEQRQEWFRVGFDARSADSCDTFNADI